MAEYSNTALQEVAANSAVLFSEAPVPCNRGIIKHRDGSGSFLVNGGTANASGCNCPCC